MARQKMYEPWEFLEQTPAVYDALNNGSDLVCAVVGAAYVEGLLGTVLKTRFVNGDTAKSVLDPTKGVLGSLKARADVAYCLELLNKQAHQDLTKIAQIRNLFAHSHVPVTFVDRQIRELCDQLQTWRDLIQGGLPPEKVGGPRGQFKLSVAILGDRIHDTAIELDAERRKHSR